MAWDRVRRASQAAYVAAAAGLVGLVGIALAIAFGPTFGAVANVAFVVMTLAIAPIMLGAYELGGVVPLWPARVSLASGIAAVLVWSIVDIAFILGLVPLDAGGGVTGAIAIEGAALLVIGAWLVGAPLLAGPWLPFHLRWLGALSGLGFLLSGAGLLLGGAFGLVEAGSALIYLFPIWAWLLARVFSSLARPAR
jgi:hypothetical protein